MTVHYDNKIICRHAIFMEVCYDFVIYKFEKMHWNEPFLVTLIFWKFVLSF
jgi:hypothetical protein